MDENELARRTNPIIMIMERRRQEREWDSAEVMRILRKRAAKRIRSESGSYDDNKKDGQ